MTDEIVEISQQNQLLELENFEQSPKKHYNNKALVPKLEL